MPTVALLRADFALAPDVLHSFGNHRRRRFRLRLIDPQERLVKSIFWKAVRGYRGRTAEGTYATDGCYSPEGAYRAACVFFAENPEYDLLIASVPGGDLKGAILAITARFTSIGPSAHAIPHLKRLYSTLQEEADATPPPDPPGVNRGRG